MSRMATFSILHKLSVCACAVSLNSLNVMQAHDLMCRPAMMGGIHLNSWNHVL